MTELQKYLVTLESKLQTDCTKDALSHNLMLKEIDSVKAKIRARARKVGVLQDGTEVKVGDTIYCVKNQALTSWHESYWGTGRLVLDNYTRDENDPNGPYVHKPCVAVAPTYARVHVCKIKSFFVQYPRPGHYTYTIFVDEAGEPGRYDWNQPIFKRLYGTLDALTTAVADARQAAIERYQEEHRATEAILKAGAQAVQYYSIPQEVSYSAPVR